MEISPYKRKVNYYETDKMGIVHHSNYIRYMEEARIDAMINAGYSYETMEAQGIIMPVTAVECEYKSPARFGETLLIEAKIDLFTGTRLNISYIMKDSLTGTVRVTGSSKHCFLNERMMPVSLVKKLPEAAAFFKKMAEN